MYPKKGVKPYDPIGGMGLGPSNLLDREGCGSLYI